VGSTEKDNGVVVMALAQLNMHEVCTIQWVTCPEVGYEWVYMGWTEEQAVMPIIRGTANMVVSDAPDCARLIDDKMSVAIESDNAYIAKLLRGEERLLDDFLVPEFTFAGKDDKLRQQAKAHFLLEGLHWTTRRVFAAVHQNPKKNAMQLISAVVGPEPRPSLGSVLNEPDVAKQALKQVPDLIVVAVAHMIEHSLANTAQNWAKTLDAVVAGACTQASLGVSLVVHESVPVNHVENFSESAVSKIADLVRKGLREMRIVHNRQSGDLIKWFMTREEKRFFSFLLSRNDFVESIQAINDIETRNKRVQRPVVNATHAIMRMNGGDIELRDGILEPAGSMDHKRAVALVNAGQKTALARAAVERINVATVNKKRVEIFERNKQFQLQKAAAKNKKRVAADSFAFVLVAADLEQLDYFALAEQVSCIGYCANARSDRCRNVLRRSKNGATASCCGSRSSQIGPSTRR
jgi:hypothetical protein